MKKLIFIIFLLGSLISAIFAFNYFTLGKIMSEVLESDPRNLGITINSHYKSYYQFSILVINVDSISGNKSAADIFRVFLQYASKMKDKKYETILLQSKGKSKFKLKGSYFKKLGLEYGQQNPVYTMRTFTENVYNIDDSKAFGKWTGGLLGVVKQQMEDFGKFHKKWYIEDM